MTLEQNAPLTIEALAAHPLTVVVQAEYGSDATGDLWKSTVLVYAKGQDPKTGSVITQAKATGQSLDGATDNAVRQLNAAALAQYE